LFGDNVAIEPKCDKCKEELDDYGAILWSPPDGRGKCDKYHICLKCFDIIVREMTPNPVS